MSDFLIEIEDGLGEIEIEVEDNDSTYIIEVIE